MPDVSMLSWAEYLNIFVVLLAIVDPPGVIPVFLGLTRDQSPPARRRTAWITSATVAAVLIGSAWFGEAFLRMFGIQIASFRIAGGLLLLLMGVTMLQGELSQSVRNPDELREAEDKEGVAVIPLAIPLLAGPGAISSMTLYAHRAAGWPHRLSLWGISLAVALITALTLLLAPPISRALGKTGVNIVVRLMGLLLAAAGIQFIADGMLQLFPALAGS